jgi:hypothetical protein
MTALGHVRLMGMKAAAASIVAVIASASCISSSAPRADAAQISAECEAAIASRPAKFATLDFFGLLTEDLHINYSLPTSFEQMWSKSDRVILGRLASVEEGNTYGGPRCSRAMHTSNLMFQVERDLKADRRPNVVVEQVHVRVVLTDDLAAKMPSSRMLVFAVDVRKYPPMPGADGGVSRPERDLYYLLSPQGLLVEGPQGQLAFPLEPDPDKWLNLSSLTMESVVERITR